MKLKVVTEHWITWLPCVLMGVAEEIRIRENMETAASSVKHARGRSRLELWRKLRTCWREAHRMSLQRKPGNTKLHNEVRQCSSGRIRRTRVDQSTGA